MSIISLALDTGASALNMLSGDPQRFERFLSEQPVERTLEWGALVLIACVSLSIGAIALKLLG